MLVTQNKITLFFCACGDPSLNHDLWVKSCVSGTQSCSLSFCRLNALGLWEQLPFSFGLHCTFLKHGQDSLSVLLWHICVWTLSRRSRTISWSQNPQLYHISRLPLPFLPFMVIFIGSGTQDMYIPGSRKDSFQTTIAILQRGMGHKLFFFFKKKMYNFSVDISFYFPVS